MTEELIEQPRGSFLGHVNVVLLMYAADGLLALALGALIARALGTSGRGVYALFVLSAAFGQVVLGLGIGNAAIYYLNKRAIPLRSIMAAAHVAVFWALMVCGILVLAVEPWAGRDLLGGDVPNALFIIAVPLLLYSNVLRLVLQAMSRFVELGFVVVAQPLVMIVLLAGAMLAGSPTPAQVIVFWMVALAATSAIALLRIGLTNIDVAEIVRPRISTLRSLVSFGVQGEAGNAVQLLNYRLDQYVVRIFVSLAGVGIYAVGVSMTEAIWLVANAVAMVLVPRLTYADPDEARAMAPVACRNTLLIAAAGALVLAAAAPVLVPLMFGRDFNDSVHALWWLLPGTIALTGSKVLTSYIFSQGRPLVNTVITAASLTVTLAADFTLIPLFGVNGAAAASSLAYIAHFGAALYAFRRISGEPVFAAVLPRREDARLYAEAARGVLARVAGRPAIGADVARRAGG